MLIKNIVATPSIKRIPDPEIMKFMKKQKKTISRWTLSNVRQRINKVSELFVRGHNQNDIADLSKVIQSTINNDIQFLRGQAKMNLQSHWNDRLSDVLQ